MNSSFGSKAIWSVVTEGVGQFGALIVSMTLAALLGPVAFGIVSMATLYVLVLQIGPRAVTTTLIQRRDLSDEHLYSGFWLILGVSAGLVAASVGLSGAWAKLNDTPELESLIVVLSALLPIQALGVPAEAILRRRMAFRLLTVRTLVATLVSGAIGIGIALAGGGEWAIVYQQLSFAATLTVSAMVAARWRPRARFSWVRCRELIGFASGTAVGGLGDFFNRRFDVLLMGLFFGPTAVGVYRLGARLLELVVGAVAQGMRSLALPDLAPRAHDRRDFNRNYVRLTKFGAAVQLPLIASLAAVADPLLSLLGDEWTVGVTSLQILCVAHSLRVFGVVDGQALQALGRPHLTAMLTWAAAAGSAVTFLAVAYVLKDSDLSTQIAGIALSRVLLYATFSLAIHFFVALGVIRLRLVSQALSPLLRPALTGLLTGGVAWLAVSLTQPLLPIAQVVVAGTVALCACVGVAVLLDVEPFNWLRRKRTRRGRFRVTVREDVYGFSEIDGA